MTVNVTKPALNIREKLAELDKPSGIAGEAMLRADSVQEQRNLIGAGRKNLIINGAMQVDQRNSGATVTGPNGFSLDRMFSFWTSASGGTVTVAQSALGNAKSIKIIATSAVTDLTGGNLVYPIYYEAESQDVYHLNGSNVTVSFTVETNWAGKLAIAFHNSANNRSYVVDADVISGTNNVAVVVPLESNTTLTNNNLIGFTFNIASCNEGTYRTSTTGSWISGFMVCSTATTQWAKTSGNFVNITGLQIELGSVATDFEHRSYGEELALCQRYYYKIDSAQNNSNYQRFAVVSCETATNAEALFVHPVTMRAVPSLETTLYSGFHIFSANAVRVLNGGMSIDQASPYSAGIALTVASGLTSGFVGLLDADNNKTAQIAFNAEL